MRYLPRSLSADRPPLRARHPPVPQTVFEYLRLSLPLLLVLSWFLGFLPWLGFNTYCALVVENVV